MSKRHNRRTYKQRGKEVKRAERDLSAVALSRSVPSESIYAGGTIGAGGRVLPDMYIGGMTAMTYGPVFACLRLTIEPIAAMPVRHMMKTPGGGQEELDSDISYLLNVQANPEMSAYNFKKAMLLQSRLWGYGVAEIERDMAGRPIWFWPLSVERMWPRRDTGGKLYYEYWTDTSSKVELGTEDILCFRGGLTFDGVTTYAPLQLAAKAVGIGLAEERFSLSYFANGAFPGGVITNKGRKLNPEGVEHLLETFNSMYQGPARAHRVLYLDGGMEYEPIKIPIESAMLLDQKTYQVEEIARWFGVPPHKLGILDRSVTAGSVEQQNMQFVGDVLIPIMTEMEGELAIKTLGRNTRGKQFFRLDPGSLLRGDLHSRYTSYATAIQWGFLSRNEVRIKEDLSPAEGLDEFMAPSNMTTAEKLGEGLGDVGQGLVKIGTQGDGSEGQGDGSGGQGDMPMKQMMEDLRRDIGYLSGVINGILGVKTTKEALNVNVQLPGSEVHLLPEINVNVERPENKVEVRPEFKIENVVDAGSEVKVEASPVQVENRYEFVVGGTSIQVEGPRIEGTKVENVYNNEFNVTAEVEGARVENKYDVVVKNEADRHDVHVHNAYEVQVGAPEVQVNVPAVENRVEIGPTHNVFEVDARPNVLVEVQDSREAPVVNIMNEVHERDPVVPVVNVVAESQPIIFNEIKVPEGKEPIVQVDNVVNVAPSPAPDVFLQVQHDEGE